MSTAHHSGLFARPIRGPLAAPPMRRSLHDLSVLFDDDGKVYAVWGYRRLQLADSTHDLDRHHSRHGARDHSRDARDGRRRALLQDRRQVLHRQRVVRRTHAHARRARRSAGGSVRSEPGDQHRRGLRPGAGQPPGGHERHGSRPSRSGPAIPISRARSPCTRAASSRRRAANGGVSR